MSDLIIGTAGTVFEGCVFECCIDKDGCQSCDVGFMGLNDPCEHIKACLDASFMKGEGNWKRIKPSAAPQTDQPTDRQYNATCMHCGETKGIQLWPHRNVHGDMIGFVFACAGCADIVRGITMEIHGIRGHSKNKNKSEFTCIDKKGGVA